MRKRTLLYIGNYLSQSTSNLTPIHILGQRLESEGYEVLYSSSKTNKLVRILDMLWACFLHRNKVELVLIDTYSTLNFYYALVVSQACRLLKLPYVPILHGGNLPSRLEHNPKLCRLIFRHAHCCVSPSRYLQDSFKQAGYGNIHYIPNALLLENYPYHYNRAKEVKLLWVRSFASIYNPALAVEILKTLKLEGIEASLCMVGPDSDGTLAKVKALAEELQVTVTFTGKLTKREWIALAKEHRVFINTTNFDNMPVSVIEAMALGLPVVSTNVGGMPYLIEHEKEGLLVPPKDTEAFVHAIKRLHTQSVFSKTLAFNARQKAEQFDWDIVRLKWQEVLGS